MLTASLDDFSIFGADFGAQMAQERWEWQCCAHGCDNESESDDETNPMYT